MMKGMFGNDFLSYPDPSGLSFLGPEVLGECHHLITIYSMGNFIVMGTRASGPKGPDNIGTGKARS